MSKETETIHFEEKEYRAYEKLAKKTRFKTVDELFNTAVKDFIKRELIETDVVQVWVPSKLLKVVKAFRSKDLEEYLSDSLTDTIAADIVAETFGDHEQVIKDFGLTDEWQFYQGH